MNANKGKHADSGRNYAVAIKLNGGMLSSSVKGWKILNDTFNIKGILSLSPCPHITILAGNCSSKETEIIDAVQKIAAEFASFEITGNGLGVFVLETPLIYVRWLFSRGLYRLYSAFESRLSNTWDNIMQSYRPEVWQPKTTIAFHDTDYKRLSAILVTLQKFDFKQSMPVKDVSLLTFCKEGETFIKTFQLSRT